MNQKQIILLVVFSSFSLPLLLLLMLGIYKYEPTLLGLPLNPLDTTKEEILTTVKISDRKLKEFERGLNEKAHLKQQRDSLEQIIRHFNDSINQIHKYYTTTNDTINKFQRAFNDSKLANMKVQDSLGKLEVQYKKALVQIEHTKEQLATQEKNLIKKQDSLEYDNFRTFAKMYENASPGEVAKILEQIEEQDAAQILKLMEKKKAGKIIDILKPEKAAAILLLGGSK